MTTGDDGANSKPTSSVVAFPFSRVAPTRHDEAGSEVTYGAFAELFGMPREQTTGHWCSRCRKIWYGYMLEVTCPMCGNRHG